MTRHISTSCILSAATPHFFQHPTLCSSEHGSLMRVRVYHNADDVFIAWKPKGVIPNCRGFALFRRRNGVEERSALGWASRMTSIRRGSAALPPTGRFRSISGPITWRTLATRCAIGSFRWWALTSEPAERHQGGERVDEDHHLSPEVTPKIEVHFNRGIVAAQWVSRRLGVAQRRLQSGQTSNDDHHAG